MARSPLSDGEHLLCGRCKIPLVIGSETEKRANGEVVIYRYYVCQACNYRLLDEKIVIEKGEDGLIIRIEANGTMAISRAATAKRGEIPRSL